MPNQFSYEASTPVATKVIREAAKDNKDAPALTLARQLFAANPGMWPNVEACRTAVRRQFGQSGRLSKDSPLAREPREAGGDWEQFLPGAWHEADKWEPLTITGATRTLNLSDLQIPFHDEAAVKVGINYGRDHGADTVILNGDIVDHYSLSEYIKDPRMRDYPAEVMAGIQFLDALRKAFPDARIIFLHGNHEDRYERYMRIHAPHLIGVTNFSWESTYKTADLGIEVVKRQQTIKLGGLRILHGHEQRVSGVFPAKTLFNRALVNALCGDVHRSSQFSEPDMDGKVVSTFTTGCLCGLHPEFMRHNKWNHGFAFIETDANGAFRVENKRIIDGKAW